MHLSSFLPAALLATLSASPALARAEDPVPPRAVAAPEDLALLLRPIRERTGVPALGAAVVEHGVTTALGVDGVRRLGRPEPVERGDLWHLGSCTKAITGVWIATFVEEGKVEWETTLGESFGDLVEGFEPRWSAVTLAELCAHRGGAPANLEEDGLWNALWRSPARGAEQRLELVRGVLRRPPAAGRGERYVYSNAGVALAAAAVEHRAGVVFERSIRGRLFEPLGIESAGFGAPGTADALDQPRGHLADGTPVEPGPAADNPDAIAPAGKVHMSLEDWAKFAACVLEGSGDAPKLLSRDGWRRIGEPAGGDYGYGWSFTTRPWAGGKVITHSGSNTMWFAVAWLAPERGLALLVTANQGGERAAKACDEVASALVRRYASAQELR